MIVYNNFLKQIKKNFKVSSFGKPLKKSIILRHDIDFEISSAVKTAKINYKNNIKGCFFIYFNSPIYNVFEKKNIQYVENLLNLNQEIGIHVDKESLANLKNIYKSLKIFFPKILKIVSFHNPGKYYKELNKKLVKHKNFRSTYEKPFFYEGQYFSDSNFRNTLNDILDNLNYNFININEVIQILLHPENLNYENLKSPEQIQEKLFFNKVDDNLNEFAKNKYFKKKLKQYKKKIGI